MELDDLVGELKKEVTEMDLTQRNNHWYYFTPTLQLEKRSPNKHSSFITTGIPFQLTDTEKITKRIYI